MIITQNGHNDIQVVFFWILKMKHQDGYIWKRSVPRP